MDHLPTKRAMVGKGHFSKPGSEIKFEILLESMKSQVHYLLNEVLKYPTEALNTDYKFVICGVLQIKQMS